MTKIEKLLKTANDRLKNSNTGISIFRRGQKLSLRGMLPVKPGSQKTGNSQQIISLGIFCNPAGIKTAEKQAQKLASEIALNEFDWDKWSDNRDYKSVEYWVRLFEKDYFARRKDTKESRTTWKSDYHEIFKRLPSSAELKPELLNNLILSTEADSRTRKRAVMVCNAIAKFSDLGIDFNKYRGNYSNTVGNRILPSDKEIIQYYHSIPNESWRYVFGIIAAYGISNHELQYVDLDSITKPPGHLISSYRKGHYGIRNIWCLYPEWFEQWQLYKKIPLPNITGKSNQDYGSRITQAFRRYKVCKPGDLRHCWAIRAMGFMPNPMAARMMAHTEAEHNKTYQRWINKKQEQIFYKLLMSREDRPKPPII